MLTIITNFAHPNPSCTPPSCTPPVLPLGPSERDLAAAFSTVPRGHSPSWPDPSCWPGAPRICYVVPVGQVYLAHRRARRLLVRLNSRGLVNEASTLTMVMSTLEAILDDQASTTMVAETVDIAEERLVLSLSRKGVEGALDAATAQLIIAVFKAPPLI